VTKTCSQCGAILLSNKRACSFCDSSFSLGSSSREDTSAFPLQDTSAPSVVSAKRCKTTADDTPLVAIAPQADQPSAWHGELTARMEAYRARKHRHPTSTAQSRFPFEHSAVTTSAPAVAVDQARDAAADDFSFTMAIGRSVQNPEKSHGRMEIDVTIPPAPRIDTLANSHQDDLTETYGAYPVASLEQRRFAAAIDVVCLLFAYGGFLALFGSLGGQFTLSKLSAAVYGVTFAIVYVQYFALFTIFGGTTPGMMFRGLQITSFTGDPPTPRQMLLRSAGYVLSAGTFFLGFFWAWWDEDALTWHDRLSHTYLGVLETHEDLKPVRDGA
jgi:uncharacterized RDD family membrane protein YckC